MTGSKVLGKIKRCDQYFKENIFYVIVYRIGLLDEAIMGRVY